MSTAPPMASNRSMWLTVSKMGDVDDVHALVTTHSPLTISTYVGGEMTVHAIKPANKATNRAIMDGSCFDAETMSGFGSLEIEDPFGEAG